MNTTILMSEIVVSTATTSIISTSVNAEPLLTALIGFGVSIITMVGGELVKFLVAFFKKKTKDLTGEDDVNKPKE